MRFSLKLGAILGFPVEIDWSWFVVFFLVTGAVKTGLLQGLHPDAYSSGMLLLAGVVGSLLFFASLLMHELAHCYVARQFGIPIAGITLFIFGGVARMKGEPSSPGDELKMALAGPAFSLVAAAFFYLVWGANLLPMLWSELARYLAIANLIVALFNLIPAFPTDGGRALRAILWGWTGNVQTATRVASWLGQAFGWLLVFYGILLFLGGNMGGIWYALIGYFLQNAAQSAYQQLQWRKAMRGLLVRDLMDRSPVTLPVDITIEEAVDGYFMREPAESLPVVTDGLVQGVLHIADIRALAKETWPSTFVQNVMRSPSPDCFVESSADAWDVLTGASQTCEPPLLVVEDGKLVGTVTQDTLARQLRLRMQIQA